MCDFFKYINSNCNEEIISNIKTENEFYDFVENIQVNFSLFSELKIEYLLKIIFNKIIFFDGDIENENFNILYEKIKTKNNKNFNILKNFILTFDTYKLIKDKFKLLINILIRIFKNNFPSLNKYYQKKLIIDDIEEIKFLIDNKIYEYYNSFFEIKYNKYFFKRIIDSKIYTNQKINEDEILNRLIQLVKIFKISNLFKLNIEIIKIKDFLSFKYNEKINYFRTFYNKTNILFKLYFKFYKKFHELNDQIINLVNIDELEYIESINDSSSSSFYSEFKQDNNFDTKYSDLTISEFNPDDEIDTPFNDNEKTKEYKNTKCITDDELENNNISIDDLFIKN